MVTLSRRTSSSRPFRPRDDPESHRHAEPAGEEVICRLGSLASDPSGVAIEVDDRGQRVTLRAWSPYANIAPHHFAIGDLARLLGLKRTPRRKARKETA